MKKIRLYKSFEPSIYDNMDHIYDGKYYNYRYINRNYFGIFLNYIYK